MRIMRVSIDEKVRRNLALFTKQFYLEDAGFAEDLFILIRLRGAGIPTDERIAAIANDLAAVMKALPLIVRSLCGRRAQLFRELASLPYFKSLCIEMKDSPVDAVGRLLTQTRKFGHKDRASQCSSCEFLATCELGTKYRQSIQDITQLALIDAAKLANPKCPHLAELNSNAEMVKLVKFLENVGVNAGATEQLLKDLTDKKKGNGFDVDKFDDSEEEMETVPNNVDQADDETDPDVDDDFHPRFQGGGTRGTYGHGTNSGNNLIMTEALLNSITKEQLALYDLGRVFDSILLKEAKGVFKPSEEIGRTNEQEVVETVGDIAKADAEQLSLPPELMLGKAVAGQLTKSGDRNPEGKRHLLYVLLDNSASMKHATGCTNALSAVSRMHFAMIFAASLAKRIQEDKGYIFVRFFAGGCSPLISAKRSVEFPYVHELISRATANGDSTNIDHALTTAWTDIQSAKDEISKAEVLLITDAEDYLDYAKMKSAKRNLKLHTLNVLTSNNAFTYGNASEVLKKVSDRYFSLDASASTVKDMVKALVAPAAP